MSYYLESQFTTDRHHLVRLLRKLFRYGAIRRNPQQVAIDKRERIEAIKGFN